MSTSVEQLEKWMQVPAEDEHLEFKAARSGFSKQQLGPYFSAFANEGGGRLILGVTDARPRKVVGTQAFGDLGEQVKAPATRFPKPPVRSTGSSGR